MQSTQCLNHWIRFGYFLDPNINPLERCFPVLKLIKIHIKTNGKVLVKAYRKSLYENIKNTRENGGFTFTLREYCRWCFRCWITIDMGVPSIYSWRILVKEKEKEKQNMSFKVIRLAPTYFNFYLDHYCPTHTPILFLAFLSTLISINFILCFKVFSFKYYLLFFPPFNSN